MKTWATLAVFTLINLVNYADRYVMAGVLPLVQGELHRTDAEMGVLTASFLVVFSIASPLAGLAGDRLNRKALIAGGVLLWSCATVWSARAQGYDELLVARALIGVGEAAYGAAAPSVIADLFDKKRRGRMLAVFYAAIPLGVGVGYAIGGAVGAARGWRTAFLVAGLPGFVLAALTLLLREPSRGATDALAPAAPAPTVRALVRTLASSRVFVINTAGATLLSFAVGGLGAWMPTFLLRARGVPLETGGMVFGAMLITAGFTGTMLGGWLSERFNNDLAFSGRTLLVGAPFTVAAVALPQPQLFWPALFAALFCLFLNTAALGASLVNAVPATMRASAVAMNVFALHVLGDALSATLVGAVSDHSSLGLGLALDAGVIALAGLVLLWPVTPRVTAPGAMATADRAGA